MVRVSTPTFSVRPLTSADAAASRRLGVEAFGVPASPPTEPPTIEVPGRTSYGAFDDDLLVARLSDCTYASWFGGAEVSTCGVAGVTVALEYRGRGVLTPLFAVTLRAARERGAVISTLFPTATKIYRRFGYELVAQYATVRLPTATLAAVDPPAGATTRRAQLADFAGVQRIYDTWGAAQNGPLTRRGPAFTATAEEYLASFTGVTLAVDGDGATVGFASWDRGQGYGDQAVLHVWDLMALTADGHRALLRALGSFATVTPQTTIRTSGADIVSLLLPSGGWPVVAAHPYMLSVLDVPGAVTARRWQQGLSVEVPFTVAGHFLPECDGGYRLAVRDGLASCEPAPTGGPVISPRGLALLYAGVQTCANLRFAGLLSGSTEHDAALDLTFSGPPVHIRDYF